MAVAAPHLTIRNNLLTNNAQHAANGKLCRGGNLAVRGDVTEALIEINRIELNEIGVGGGCVGFSITAGNDISAGPECMRRFTIRCNTGVGVGHPAGRRGGSSPREQRLRVPLGLQNGAAVSVAPASTTPPTGPATWS